MASNVRRLMKGARAFNDAVARLETHTPRVPAAGTDTPRVPIATVHELPAAAYNPRVLDDVRSFLTRFVAFAEPAQADAVALWIVHSHAFDHADATPRLAIQSAEKQSGKTRLLEVLDLLVRSPLSVASISAAALFRTVSEGGTTLLIDEADTIFDGRGGKSEDLRGMLNAGYRRAGAVARVAGGVVERFPVFAPVALAGIGTLPDTVQDRAIVVRLKRRDPTCEPVEKLRRRDAEPEAETLRASIRKWVASHGAALAVARPVVPSELGDRAADIWEPLLAIAAEAGDEWPDVAARAAVTLARQAKDAEGATGHSVGLRLLADVRRVLATVTEPRIASADLVTGLRKLEEGNGWADLDTRSLARMLLAYDVRPKSIRFGDAVVRGYEAGDLADAFGRYLPPVAV